MTTTEKNLEFIAGAWGITKKRNATKCSFQKLNLRYLYFPAVKEMVNATSTLRQMINAQCSQPQFVPAKVDRLLFLVSDDGHRCSFLGNEHVDILTNKPPPKSRRFFTANPLGHVPNIDHHDAPAIAVYPDIHGSPVARGRIVYLLGTVNGRPKGATEDKQDIQFTALEESQPLSCRVSWIAMISAQGGLPTVFLKRDLHVSDPGHVERRIEDIQEFCYSGGPKSQQPIQQELTRLQKLLYHNDENSASRRSNTDSGESISAITELLTEIQKHAVYYGSECTKNVHELQKYLTPRLEYAELRRTLPFTRLPENTQVSDAELLRRVKIAQDHLHKEYKRGTHTDAEMHINNLLTMLGNASKDKSGSRLKSSRSKTEHSTTSLGSTSSAGDSYGSSLGSTTGHTSSQRDAQTGHANQPSRIAGSVQSRDGTPTSTTDSPFFYEYPEEHANPSTHATLSLGNKGINSISHASTLAPSGHTNTHLWKTVQEILPGLDTIEDVHPQQNIEWAPIAHKQPSDNGEALFKEQHPAHGVGIPKFITDWSKDSHLLLVGVPSTAHDTGKTIPLLEILQRVLLSPK